MSDYLGMDLITHCASYSEWRSSRKRKWHNKKTNLTKAKVCEEKALPLVFMSMKGKGSRKRGLSSFQIIMGRPMKKGMSSPHERQPLGREEFDDAELMHSPR